MPYGPIDAKLVFVGIDGNTGITADVTAAASKIAVPKGARRGGLRFGIFVPQALVGATGLTAELKQSSDGTTFTSLNPPAIYTVVATKANDVDFPVEFSQPWLGVALVSSGTYSGTGAGKVLCYMTPVAAGVTGQLAHNV